LAIIFIPAKNNENVDNADIYNIENKEAKISLFW